MQIDLEMTFIVWGSHMQAYRTTRADKKMSTKPTTAQFMRSKEEWVEENTQQINNYHSLRLTTALLSM